MPTLTQQQMDNLQDELDDDDVSGFYSLLESYGDDYGTLGAAVTDNDTWQGQLANNFADYAAGNNSVDLSHGGTAWSDLNADIAQRYLDEYVTNSGTTPIWSDVQELHNRAYEDAGLDEDDWFPNKLLNDSSDPSALWDDYMSNDGGGDLIEDSFGIAKTIAEAMSSAPDHHIQRLDNSTEYTDGLKFLVNLMNAIHDLDGSKKLDMAADFVGEVADLVLLMNVLPDGALGGFAGAIPDILDDMAGIFDLELPDLIDSPLDGFGDSEDQASPLVLDLDGDGIELTTFNAATTTTFFDLNSDGLAEQTAWVSSDDGLLARDIDDDGKIDNASELFGSPTIDGFAKLALLDTNGDLIIDQHDDAWDELRVWQDTNGDAVTQDGELKTLASLDIVSIDLAGVDDSTSTINGNAISHTSTFRYDDDSTDTIADAWFVHDKVNTQFAGDFTADLRAFVLPTMRGYGKLADLHIAMSQDEDLLDLVEDFVTDYDLSVFANPTTLSNDVEDILFTWAGVDTVSATSRGSYVDGQHLEFMEEFFGREWKQGGVWDDPFIEAGETLTATFFELRDILKAQLLMQVGMADLFGGDASFNVITGDYDGTFGLDQDFIDDLETEASKVGVDEEAFWEEVARFIDATKGLSNLTGTEEGWLDTAVSNSGYSGDWEDIEDLLADPGYQTTDPGTSAAETINGSSGNDQLGGSAGYDLIYGLDGNDELQVGVDGGELYGGDGNDTLTGGSSTNDTLSGGAGGDTALGYSGNDIYEYTSGDDYYDEVGGGGTDKITLPTGIDSNDLTIERINEDDSMLITVDGLGTIQIKRFFYGAADKIETIEFDDTSTLDLTTLTTMTFYGSTGDDNLVATSGIDYTINGLAGDDILTGNDGDDVLDGGVGNDTLQGGTGDDEFIMSEGFDTLSDSGGDETLVIAEGYTLDDVSFIATGQYNYDLKILVKDFGQVVFLGQMSSSSTAKLESIEFLENSTTVDLDTISIEQRGGDGADSLTGLSYGVSTDDILNGMGGNDTLQGGAGNDTYIFSEGEDVIFESSGNADKIVFWDGWDPDDISVYQAKAYGYGFDDLVVQDSNGNKMIIESYFDYPSGGGEIETIEFADETSWDLTTMEFELWGTTGNDSLATSDSNGTTFRMFSGNDYVQGYTGSDTYLYSEGLDSIYDGGGGDDTIWITGGTTINDISISDSSSYDATITINASTDEIYIYSLRYFNSAFHVENLKFDDGFVTDQLPDYANWIEGTSGADTVTGTTGDNVLIGLAGNDTIDADSGDDDAHGGAGDDTINGDAGDDLLHGGAGDDTLYGDDGLDTLFGGAGADTFMFDSGEVSEIDQIMDFSTADGDVIDLSDVISYDPMSDVITDFIQFSDSGSDTTVSIDADGTGGFTQIATIVGVTGIEDEAALVTSGNLIAA